MLRRAVSFSPRCLHARFVSSLPHFPCVDQNESRSRRLYSRGLSHPEPSYSSTLNPTIFSSSDPLKLDYGSSLPSFDVAYETWGTLNADRSNAILLHTGLSASSHARSSPSNPTPGWWESFIGPGKPIDTNSFYVICTNVIGGCYGSTGPSSTSPDDAKPYATRFPLISVFDMVRAQFRLLDHLGIDSLYASVGSSMGAMQSLAAVHLYPERVRNLVAMSGTARTSPASIALRYAQRSVLMSDPHWNRGFYYDGIPPHTEIATITYRSGPEWEQRFGRRRKIQPSSQSQAPHLCPDFLIETYLDHQGEQFCLKYDANSLIYISKAMDLFDMTASGLEELSSAGTLSPPDRHKQPEKPHISTLASPSHLSDLAQGLSNLSRHRTLIIGVQSDILFPVNEQRELAEALRMIGNHKLSYYELNSPYGHDSFLVDFANVGGALHGFLSDLS